ncbi:MAG: hypothetical protein ABFQ62_00925 [Patescibacteria group bacterium]
MKKVSDSVRAKVQSDEIAFEAMRSGIMNLSAYAKSIQDDVEKDTWKNVSTNSLVVALSRVAKELKSGESLRPDFSMEDLTIRSPLSDVSFAKTKENLEQLHAFQKDFIGKENQFFMMTQSVREITIILAPEHKQLLFSYMKSEPKEIFDNLVAITISFSPEYLTIPNVIYTIIAQIALQRVNIREIVSTYTELSIVIDEKEMQKAIEALQVFSKR